MPNPQEEEDATVRFTLPMDQDDPPEVMLQIEETQLFFLAHPEVGRGYTGVQMIHQATANLRAHGHLYAEALTIWLHKDPAHRVIWTNFKTCMYQHYERMLQERGG